MCCTTLAGAALPFGRCLFRDVSIVGLRKELNEISEIEGVYGARFEDERGVAKHARSSWALLLRPFYLPFARQLSFVYTCVFFFTYIFCPQVSKRGQEVAVEERQMEQRNGRACGSLR